MAAGIAHEINNPLTGVVGFSDLLLKKDLPEDIRKDVSIIYEGSRRISSIVDRMLRFARQSKPEQTIVNINDIIETTLAMRVSECRPSAIMGH
ncbi:histidine kinase dimerization/phospho-acceptor domain-containing protein [Chloroflexota bacterium]